MVAKIVLPAPAISLLSAATVSANEEWLCCTTRCLPINDCGPHVSTCEPHFVSDSTGFYCGGFLSSPAGLPVSCGGFAGGFTAAGFGAEAVFAAGFGCCAGGFAAWFGCCAGGFCAGGFAAWFGSAAGGFAAWFGSETGGFAAWFGSAAGFAAGFGTLPRDPRSVGGFAFFGGAFMGRTLDGRHCGFAVVDRVEVVPIARCRFLVRDLRIRRFDVPFASERFLLRGRTHLDSTASAVIAGAVDHGLVDDGAVDVRVVDDRRIDARDCGVVRERAVAPLAAVVAVAGIAVPVVYAAVVADLRAPIAGRPASTRNQQVLALRQPGVTSTESGLRGLHLSRSGYPIVAGGPQDQ